MLFRRNTIRMSALWQRFAGKYVEAQNRQRDSQSIWEKTMIVFAIGLFIGLLCGIGLIALITANDR